MYAKGQKNTQYKIIYIFEILFIYLYILNVKKMKDEKHTHETQQTSYERNGLVFLWMKQQ